MICLLQFCVFLATDFKSILKLIKEGLGITSFPIAVGLLAGLIAVGTFIRTKLWKKKAPKYASSFSYKDIEEKSEDFIANHFEVEGGYASKEEAINNNYEKSHPLENIKRFIKHIILSTTASQKFYFLEAGTGVGKTSFLTNLYRQYNCIPLPRKKRQGKIFYFFYKLLLGLKFSFLRQKFFILQFFKSRKPNMVLVSFAELSQAGMDKHEILSEYQDKKFRKNTVLLIDGMDEYTVGKEHESYWEMFQTNWDTLYKDLQQFKKVIISVRNQFFEQDKKDKLSKNKGSHQAVVTIELSLFKIEQADWYLEKRFKSDKPGPDPLFNTITGLMSIFREKGYEFAHIPLILYYMDAIASHYNNQTKFISKFGIYDAIVDSWITREATQKIAISSDKDQGAKMKFLKDKIRKFCIALSYKIYEKKGDSVSENELRILEKDNGLSGDTFTFNSRSLLVRKEFDSKSIEYRYGFIHKAFFEFFLLEYQLEQEERGSNANEIDFTNHTLAQEMYILKRWDAVKMSVPKTKPNLKNETFNLMPLDDIKLWHNFFMGFSQNKSLMGSLVEGGMNLIESYDKQGYDTAFESLRNLVILNKRIEFEKEVINFNNFWDDTNKQPQPYPETLELVPFIKDFIIMISLKSLPKLKEMEHLKCFERLRNLAFLIITECEITGEGLQYFKASAETLVTLNLHSNQISNDKETLKVFKGARLELLYLAFNQITGEGLQYFAESAKTLKELKLHNNQISNDKETLKVFKGARLELLYLAFNQITGEGLQYFAESANTLKELKLQSNQIKNDGEVFKAFNGAYQLEKLHLSDNKITGEGLKYFAKSTKLQELSLFSNSITKNLATVLQPYKSLEKLWIDNDVLMENSSLHSELIQRNIKIHFFSKSTQPTSSNEHMNLSNFLDKTTSATITPTQKIVTTNENITDYWELYNQSSQVAQPAKEPSQPNSEQEKQRYDQAEQSKDNKAKKPRINLSTIQCPCGSSKRYLDCHGKTT